jgi:hypothetical protein
MKTAIYIEDGVVQLVLTPESEFEKNTLKSFEGKEANAKIFSGAFYDCRGGWIRQTHHIRSAYGNDFDSNDKSLILRIEPEQSK